METLENDSQNVYITSLEGIHEYGGNFRPFPDINPAGQLYSKNVQISIFGKPQNWKDNIINHPEVLQFLYEKKIKEIYLPDSSVFTGTILNSTDFYERGEIRGVNIMGGRKTEGLILPSQSSVLMRTADCPTIIYHDITNDVLIVAHAGFGSIIDKQRIVVGFSSRYNESVVDDIMGKVPETDDYEIHIVCGIHYNSFVYNPSHPIYGEDNKKILDYLIEIYGEIAVPLGLHHGGISIQSIIKKQFLDYGLDVDRISTDNIDTYSDPRFWSHSRSVRLNEQISGRNGVLVLHK
jgi:copper oxidase (laccase) domain-containing protein